MKNVHMCYIRVTEGKIENLKKEGKMRISTLVFIYTIHFSYLKVRGLSQKVVDFCYNTRLCVRNSMKLYDIFYIH